MIDDVFIAATVVGAPDEQMKCLHDQARGSGKRKILADNRLRVRRLRRPERQAGNSP
jgi:hypothetical protein